MSKRMSKKHSSTDSTTLVAPKHDGSVACWGQNDFGQCDVQIGRAHV